MIKRLKSKTYFLGHVITILGALQANSSLLEGLINAKTFGWIMFTCGILTYIIRELTTTPVSEK